MTRPPHTFFRSALRAAQLAGLLLWATALVLLCGTLASRHLLPVPVASDALINSRLQAAVDGMRPVEAAKTWLAVHVIYLDCACSRRVLEHLMKRGTDFVSLASGAAGAATAAPLVEHLLLIGTPTDALCAQARARGFQVHAISPAELQRRFGLSASPLLLVADQRGQIRYLGGYSPRKRGEEHDIAILRDVMNGRAVTPLPAFGCATSDRLRAAVDPLKLRSLSADL